MKETRPWWKDAVIYQIYPRSFYDTNHDGVGDLQGIIEKLDYLNDGTEDSLGVDAIWVSPIYPSPMKDCGYDISNYNDIDPLFGDLEIFKNLLKQAHKRGIKVLMDLVINHTSDQHPWFQESRDKNSPKADWYLWHPQKANNWLACLELKSAWHFDEKRGEYYLGTFTRFQPELNWRNPEVKAEIYKMISYWLDLGVDGFRMDVVNWFVKDEKLRSNPWHLKAFPDLFQKHIYDRNRPEVHEICKEIREIADRYPGDRLLVGEIFTDNFEEAASYYGISGNNDELHLTFNFDFMYQPWKAKRFYQAINNWYSALPVNAWPTITLSNHDYFRHFSRYKKGKWSEARAKVALAMTLFLKGTPFLYYGEEIGMENTKVPRQKAMDPLERFPFIPGRARSRTPMQWNASDYAGFSTHEPWLPLNQKFREKNVFDQNRDKNSLLNFYRKLLWLRKKYTDLVDSEIDFLNKGEVNFLSFKRGQYLVFLNFDHHEKEIPSLKEGEIIFCSNDNPSPKLSAYEIRIIL